MKAYYLVSPYLSDIQKGIQVSHCTVEMARKARNEEAGFEYFYEWADKHKTMVVLNYGFDRNLVDILMKFFVLGWAPPAHEDKFWSFFTERELNDLKTFGFILAESEVRYIGTMRQERRFEVSETLLKNSVWAEACRSDYTMSKKEWMRYFLTYDQMQFEWSDFLKAVSMLHPA